MSFPLHIVSVAVLLGGLIFFHELGHFLVAKAFRVKVLKFSLGFGPRLLGFTWGETEYRLSLLPLGGYVKMAGDDPSTPLDAADKGRGFLEQRPWKRMAIAFAGPAFNLIFPLMAYFAVFAAQTEAVAPHVGQVIAGMPAAKAGLKPGDRIVSIDGEPIYAFQDLRRFVDPSAGKPLVVVVDRDGANTTFTVTPDSYLEPDPIEPVRVGKIGVSPNPAAPVVGVSPGGLVHGAGLRTFDRIAKIDGEEVGSIDQALARLKSKLEAGAPFEVLALRGDAVAAGPVDLPVPEPVKITIQPEEGASLGVESAELYVSRVAPGTPAAEAGLVRGDRLLSLDGSALETWQQVEAAQREKADKPFTLDLVRDGETRSLTLAQAAKTETDELRDRPVTVYTFGAYGGLPAVAAPVVKVPFRPLLAAQMAVGSTWEVARKIARGMGMIVTGQIAFKNVGGPLQIYDIATKAADQGWEIFLHTMAMVSINLGLVNLFPVPVLDGGHIVQAGIEAIRRKPLSMRAREITNAVGLAMLLTLMVFALKNDVVRYFLAG
ncbi:RIP metalloprotease RseP [Vulgatibacter incomptus]|uniref:Membrane-associated zinc metalloprotease n=1 Tax=Vulgatibacter incomptus TaxID=1391653 RepID=A0A0K1PD84_9BACT|nr:RIP metalloprotease RseP [Vulgatibacter incomptus]AKU91361.1 Membrane-associated zinc metalloprotease [Vulgatibacter incomptus]